MKSLPNHRFFKNWAKSVIIWDSGAFSGKHTLASFSVVKSRHRLQKSLLRLNSKDYSNDSSWTVIKSYILVSKLFEKILIHLLTIKIIWTSSRVKSFLTQKWALNSSMTLTLRFALMKISSSVFIEVSDEWKLIFSSRVLLKIILQLFMTQIFCSTCNFFGNRLSYRHRRLSLLYWDRISETE